MENEKLWWLLLGSLLTMNEKSRCFIEKSLMKNEKSRRFIEIFHSQIKKALPI